MTDYGYSVEVPEGYDEAVVRARMALRGEGFSILTEMHVGGLLGPEAGSERQYLIMAAWNPAISPHRIDSNLQVAIQLPCNVVVQQQGSSAIVAAMDPVEDSEGQEEPYVHAARAARDALQRALVMMTNASRG